jgi:hypothetical protein
MRALGQTLAREFGNNHGVDVQSYLEATVGNMRTPLRVLLGAVFCVLLIACANVANPDRPDRIRRHGGRSACGRRGRVVLPGSSYI